MSDASRFEDGLAVRRAVLGDEYVDRALAQMNTFTAPMQELATTYAWGSVWAREGLDRRTRSAITLAVLTTLGREHELALHVRGALRNGLLPAEIGEILLHTSVYAGVPAGIRAFAVANEIIEEQSAGEGPALAP